MDAVVALGIDVQAGGALDGEVDDNEVGAGGNDQVVLELALGGAVVAGIDAGIEVLGDDGAVVYNIYI